MDRKVTSRLPVRVLAVGSAHGDDQVAWQALECLRTKPVAGVEWISVATPFDLLDHLQNCQVAIVLDACRTGAPAGSVHSFSWPLACESTDNHSSHGFGVAAALTLAQSLGRSLPPIRILGVEVGSCEPGAELSADCQAALPLMVRRVLDEVRACVPAGMETANCVDQVSTAAGSNRFEPAREAGGCL